MSEHRLDEPRVKRPFLPRMVRRFAIPIIFFWGFLAVTMTAFTPKVEDVAEELAGPMVPHYAPSQRALLHIGEKFHESNSTNLTMVVFEAQNRQLGDQDHAYYDDLVKRFQRDTKHVQYVMDLWGQPFTAAGAQSVDGKCTYVLLRLAGDIGQMEANESVNTVRDIIAKDPPPPGLKAFVSGAAPLASDTLSIANASLNNVTIITIILILVMLMFVYRSRPRCWPVLLGVLIEMLFAKGLISIPRASRIARVVLVRSEHRHRTDLGSRDGLRHLPDGALSRGSASRREPRRQLLHRLQGRHADHHRVRADDRRRVLLPDVCAPELLPHHGSGCRDHHAVHHRRGADARSRDFDGGQPVRDVRSATGRQGASCIGGSARAWCAGRCRSWSPVRPSSCWVRSSCRAIGRTTTIGSTSRTIRSRIWVSKPPTDTSPRANCSPRC